jgi:hypothetical protein
MMIMVALFVDIVVRTTFDRFRLYEVAFQMNRWSASEIFFQSSFGVTDCYYRPGQHSCPSISLPNPDQTAYMKTSFLASGNDEEFIVESYDGRDYIIDLK